MKMRKLAFCIWICTYTLLQWNCSKDDGPKTPSDGDNPSPVETFYNITQATINDDEYTAPGELFFLYSIDNGDSFTAEKPEDLSKGDELWVKINNGEVDLSEEDFSFDWSDSSLAPANATNAVAKFVVKESDISIASTIIDKIELLVSNRNTGQFFVLDLSDGGLTPAFTFLEGELPLERVRGVVFNYNNGNLYVTTTKFGLSKSQLYKVDTNNMQATVINENSDSTWSGISDLVITEGNKILATIGFSGGDTPALIEFDLDGTASDYTLVNGDDIPCCGLGMTYGTSMEEILIGTGFSDPLKIYKSDLQGKISDVHNLTLEGFENTNPASYFIRNLIKTKNGEIYALCFEDGDSNTHIAQVDLENNLLKHISQIGSGTQQRYNGLVQIPAYAF